MDNFDPEQYLLYFKREVLAQYRVSPDRFSVQEESGGGKIETLHNQLDDDSRHPYFRVRYGLRRLANGDICIAALEKDISNLPDEVQRIWVGYHLPNPLFSGNDPNFENWVMYTFYGGGGSDQYFPLRLIRRELPRICAITKSVLGKYLFRESDNPLMALPIAENKDAYQKAHVELNRLLVDGLDREAIKCLASNFNIKLADPNQRLNSLKEVLPSSLHDIIHKPLQDVLRIRNNIHALPSVEAFSAIETFKQDVEVVAKGVKALREWLEKTLNVDAEVCQVRESRLADLPKIVGPSPAQEMLYLTPFPPRWVGKTIESTKYGMVMVGESSFSHTSEALILKFTDGSMIAINIGSNVSNLIQEHSDLKPNDFHTDLMFTYVPAISEDTPKKTKDD